MTESRLTASQNQGGVGVGWARERGGYRNVQSAIEGKAKFTRVGLIGVNY